jgi:hypothetical protein
VPVVCRGWYPAAVAMKLMISSLVSSSLSKHSCFLTGMVVSKYGDVNAQRTGQRVKTVKLPGSGREGSDA